MFSPCDGVVERSMRQCPKCGKRYLEANARICDVDGAVLDLLVVASERDRLVGTTVNGRYNVDGVLGDGGMGVVYRATGPEKKTYAIKVLRAEYSAEEDLVLRFEQEAQAAHDVRNPHIVEIYEWGSLPDGSRFFVMEYLEGKSLGDLLALMPKPPGSDRREPMSEAFTLHIALQIADGLAAAHAAGVVHRDIKPDNFHIVSRPDDEFFVKILDFGIAKVQNSKAARTRTGSVFGTPHYMSPEQASGDRNIDAKTDIYGLGVMLYEMVVGKIPFDADNLMGILTAHLYHTPTPPRVYPECAALTPAFEAVILKCLAKSRDDRYDSMTELYADLTRCRDGLTSFALEDQESHTVQFRRADFAVLRSPSSPSLSPPGFDDNAATNTEIALPDGMSSGSDLTLPPPTRVSGPPPVTAFSQPAPSAKTKPTDLHDPAVTTADFGLPRQFTDPLAPMAYPYATPPGVSVVPPVEQGSSLRSRWLLGLGVVTLGVALGVGAFALSVPATPTVSTAPLPTVTPQRTQASPSHSRTASVLVRTNGSGTGVISRRSDGEDPVGPIGPGGAELPRPISGTATYWIRISGYLPAQVILTPESPEIQSVLLQPESSRPPPRDRSVRASNNRAERNERHHRDVHDLRRPSRSGQHEAPPNTSLTPAPPTVATPPTAPRRRNGELRDPWEN